MLQSGSWSPSPVPLMGSLLVTDVILHVGVLALSVATAVTVINTIWWFGGRRTEGLAVRLMTGGSVSLMATLKEHADWLPATSVAVQIAVVVPIGKIDPDGGLHAELTPGFSSVAVTA